MTTPEKAKGSQWERAVVAYLQEHGFPRARRRYGAGNTKDEGDIAGFPRVVFECKNHKTINLAQFMDEVVVEKGNAGALFGVSIVKRRNKPVGMAYVVMSLEDFVQWLGNREKL